VQATKLISKQVESTTKIRRKPHIQFILLLMLVLYILLVSKIIPCLLIQKIIVISNEIVKFQIIKLVNIKIDIPFVIS